MKPILIIQAGHTFPEIAAAHGDFDDMVYRALNGKQRKTRVVDVSRAAVLPAPSSCAAAVITAGGFGRSRARSTLVTTIATPPSLSWQQSNRRTTGSMIQREA